MIKLKHYSRESWIIMGIILGIPLAIATQFLFYAVHYWVATVCLYYTLNQL